MATHADLLPRYKQLRQAGVKLNVKLGKMVSRSEMDEGGKRPGILDGDVLLLDTDDEIAVLMDPASTTCAATASRPSSVTFSRTRRRRIPTSGCCSRR